MSTLSRFALVLAVSLSACSDRSPVGPQSNSGFSGTAMPTSGPTDLRASFVGPDGYILISWSYRSDSNGSIAAPEFLVERALDLEGPWSIVRFTRGTSIADFLTDGLRYCYRVGVATRSDPSTRDSSGPVCIQRF